MRVPRGNQALTSAEDLNLSPKRHSLYVIVELVFSVLVLGGDYIAPGLSFASFALSLPVPISPLQQL